MRYGKRVVVFVFFLFFLSFAANSYSQYHLSYDYVMELAFGYIKDNDFDNALHYLNLAQQIEPYSQEPVFYINLIKRIKEGRVREIIPPIRPNKQSSPLRTVPVREHMLPSREKEVSKLLDKFDVIESRKKKLLSKKKVLKRKRTIESALSVWENKTKPTGYKEVEKTEILKQKFFKKTEAVKKKPAKQISYISFKNRPSAGKLSAAKVKKRTLHLTDELFSAHRKITVQIGVNSGLIIEGKNIKRFLVINPHIINVKRLGSGGIKVISKNIGETFLHIWKGSRRLTLNVKVVSPVFVSPARERKMVYEAEPFKFMYSSDWDSYYRGRRLGTMNRESITFDQWLGFYGDTPYGKMDASLKLGKYGSNTELTNYTLGITNGKAFGFEGFNARIFDIYKGFSELSYPGELIKGGLWESYAFNKKVNYSLIWGRERELIYGYITPGVLRKKDSYIEGVRITFLPMENTNYSFNYARGYGRDREDYLKDKVYSLQVEHNRNNRHISSEISYDGDSMAGFVKSRFSLGRINLGLSFRDIEKGFTTITGYPADQGEIGGIINLDMDVSKSTHFNSTLDIYRDRYMFNEAKKRKPNFDWQTNIEHHFSPTSSLNTAVYYVNEPGLSFPRRYLSARSTYYKGFSVFNNKSLYLSFGAGYQKSINPLSRASDYNLYNISSSLRYSLTKSLSYYCSYTYSWLTEKINSQKSTPSVMETGIDYYKRLNPFWNADARFYYRNEEDTTSTHSFLAGEDSIEGNLHLSYTPRSGVEFFMDGRLRNVWAENPDVDKYIEGEIRLGLRSTLDMPFRWSPKGKVSGIVFKDVNSNGKLDNGEPPLPGIRVIVGKKKLITDKRGRFSTNIRAKRVVVMVDSQSLPPGYVFTTPSLTKVDIHEGENSTVVFGAATNSSIYGVVFYDLNGNGKFDRNEHGVGRVKITVGKASTFTNSEGRYFFRGLKKGTYIISFDVNTIPLKYLPAVPVKNKIKLAEGINYLFYIPLNKKK